jgi:hypothetical protein
LSGPARLVNRDVPVADEQAYIRAGYQRGSIEEVPETPKSPMFATEEVSLEEPDPTAETPKPRRKKGQN